MTTESSAGFATFAATADALGKLNIGEHGLFVQLNSLDIETGEFYLDYKTETGIRETVGRIYECGGGYHCVAVCGDIWQAPIVWSGPRAPWDTSTDKDTLTNFATLVCKALTSAGGPLTPVESS